MQFFDFYKKEKSLAFTKLRTGETKLGEKILSISDEKNWETELQQSSARYVIIGIPESIGVKANFGIGGTETAWKSFLFSFLNIQHNQFLNAEDILLLGAFDFSSFQEKIKNKSIEFLRDCVSEIDELVYPVIQKIILANKIPIIIGGGHNNAYGNCKGAALALQQKNNNSKQKINVINIDAHTDFRAIEGRHSGNGFSYAMHEGFLDKYAVVGVQENYISQQLLTSIQENKNIQLHFCEDIFLKEKYTLDEAIQQSIAFTNGNSIGLEVDVDVIENIVSSAMSPSGFSVNQVRKMITQIAKQREVSYLHFCEGTAQLENGNSSPTIGKLLAFLVSDFIKANIKKS